MHKGLGLHEQPIEVTDKMIEEGISAARRTGLNPVITYDEFLKFKEGLVAAYRAMRVLEHTPPDETPSV